MCFSILLKNLVFYESQRPTTFVNLWRHLIKAKIKIIQHEVDSMTDFLLPITFNF